MRDYEGVTEEAMNAVAGQVLKRARKRAQLSQAEVAERAGLSQSQLSRMEKGENAISLFHLAQLAAVTNASAEDFFEQLLFGLEVLAIGARSAPGPATPAADHEEE